MNEPRWYHEPWAIGILFVLLPPLGFLCLWLSVELAFRRKLLLSLTLLFIVASLAFLEWHYATFSWTYCELLASAKRELGSKSKELPPLRRAIELMHQEPLNRLALAGVLLEKGDLEGARANFIAARSLYQKEERSRSRGFAQSSLGLVEALMEDGAFERARSQLELLQQEYNFSLSSFRRYGLIRARLLIDEGKLGLAENELRQLIKEFHSSLFGECYELLARIRELEGERHRELYFLCEALRYREGEPELEQRILRCAREQSRNLLPFRAYVRAMRYRRCSFAAETTAKLLLKIVRCHKDFIFADGCIYTAAYCYFAHEEDYHRAYKLYERVAKEYPDSESFGKALWQASLCYEELGLPRHLQEALKRMLRHLESGSMLRKKASFELRRARWREEERLRELKDQKED